MMCADVVLDICLATLKNAATECGGDDTDNVAIGSSSFVDSDKALS
jgi:hypothetical protein